ncbi:tRNA lysidine(34) synthetase TilS [Kordia jejudonensis]|uniref:tRNA lysidine(34) synthetase TilS n=1 Tax=Kordia jejudonensis TaxID=1348245 RepID=UPI000629689A|nr:tRNA lysidine(34) synthetase TilS [Kordia jejudonensis]
MLENLKKHIAKKLPFLQQQKLLIAISGGLDSVVMAHMFHALHYNIAFAHCNFQLRDAESDGDAIFVENLAKTLQVECHTKKFDTENYANQQKVSIQMAARSLRYAWFEELATTFEYDYILTAHHADDALETFIINLSRGTGIDGLTGIPMQNGNIMRPLLPFTRIEILAYAKQHKLAWREDSSNASTKYIRNKIRHDLVPMLKELHPTFMENFQATQQHLQESKHIITASIEKFQKEVITETSEGVFSIDIKKVQDNLYPKAYLFEILRPYGFTAWKDIVALLNGQSGKQINSKTYRLIKDRVHLLLQPLHAEENIEAVEITEHARNITNPIQLQWEEVSTVTTTGNSVLYVDKALLKFPLTVRKWKNGDYFYPYGMKGKKKLSKYFKDEKYSLIDKENQWLLCNEGQIVWVIGKRSDNRYKLTQPTNSIIKFTLK